MPTDTTYRVLGGTAYDMGREKARLDGDYLAQSLAHYDA